MTTKKQGKKPSGVSFLLLQRRELGAAEFKAHCLEILDEVEKTGREVLITKHRKPVARVVPATAGATSFCGSLKGMVLREGDLVSPIDVEWGDDAADFA